MFCIFSYFRSLVEQFEVQLQQYRQQIEELENHLTTQSSGNHITPQGKMTLRYVLTSFWMLVNINFAVFFCLQT